LFCPKRIEKERQQAKAEADDLRGQIDHITKAKVHIYVVYTSNIDVNEVKQMKLTFNVDFESKMQYNPIKISNSRTAWTADNVDL
jgi:hypothetical protein